ncbi:MAG TPA: clostripain-related cysteine peptidase [Pyrinomonadaceae bacterium]|jgi:hypothetical protein
MSKTPKEWTLMFYCASDNPLAPSIVSQLKALKQAGYHHDANVIARFDPHQDNTPAHIFDVNLAAKLQNPDESQIGFDGKRANDPFVQNLVMDKLWSDKAINGVIEKALNESRNRDKDGDDIVYDPPPPTKEMLKEQGPMSALASFLKFCLNNYPANRYMLVILGHGIVVGNDLFLLDEHVDDEEDAPARSREEKKLKGRRKNSLMLKELAAILKEFKKNAGRKLELLSFHSCSMSSLEVAYELEGCANYMLASQGPAFVGSWPYKQILIRIFNDLEKRRKTDEEIDVRDTAMKIFFYCLYNSYDFQLAGYSFDASLCDLNKVPNVKGAINELAETLSESLSDRYIKEYILLSHWEAQSFWQESYTDLYDFCFCLFERCENAPQYTGETAARLQTIKKSCLNAMNALQGSDSPVIISDFAGPLYQYSHGFSVFFPWAKPTNISFWEEYKQYEFSAATKWHEFLEAYFDKTMRLTRGELSPRELNPKSPKSSVVNQLLEEIAVSIAEEDAQLSKGGANDATGGKGGANDPTGSTCDCPAIKNYPSRTRSLRESRKQKR